jgi:ATP-dependent protease ClpP protease subunit
MKSYRVVLTEARRKAEAKPKAALSKVANDTLTIYGYDVIGEDFFGEGITPKMISEVLDSETYSKIMLRIDSPGGDPFAASAILNLLKSTGKPITAVIDGLAASAASLLAMAADDIRMGEGSMFMIHNAWTIAAGNATELRKVADDLEHISATMRDIYVARTGLSADEVQQIMNGETWLGPAEAIDKGFADGMVEHEAPAPEPATASRARLERELAIL